MRSADAHMEGPATQGCPPRRGAPRTRSAPVRRATQRERKCSLQQIDTNNSRRGGPTEPGSTPFSSVSAEPPRVLTPQPEPGGFDYLGSSAPAPILARPQQFTETLVRHLDTELPAGPDQFALPGLDLNDNLSRHQKLLEADPTLDWIQNQALAMPPQLKSRSHTAALNQAEDNQSFEILVPPLEDSQSSKSAKFIASPSNLKKDLAHHRQLAKIGNSDQLAKTLEDQSYESDLLDPSLDIFYPPDGLPLDLLENLDELSESPEEADLSPHEWEIQTQHLEPAEELEQSQTQQEAPAEHPEPTEKVEPSPAQQENPAQSSDTLEGAELPAGQLEAPAQPSEDPEEAELPPVQPYDPAQPSEAHEEAEPPPFQPEVPAQPPEPEREAAHQPPGNLVVIWMKLIFQTFPMSHSNL
nr:leucine-rich repeat-containing protein 37B-like isoform X1 [Dasypus novemcinctus]